MTDTDERQAGDEIEVTEEMIRAGGEVIYQHDLFGGPLSLAGDIAREAYVAMRRCRSRCREDSTRLLPPLSKK